MEVITTIHGKPCALYEGYSYIVKRSNEDGTVIWRCQKQRSARCRGTIKTKDGNVLSSNEHQCGAPDDARLEVKKSVNRARKRAREEDTSIFKIYSDELGELHNRGYDFVTEMPGQQIVKRTLYNHRAKLQGNQKEPKSSLEVELPAELVTMKDGSNFLLKDDKSDERLIVFSAQAGIEVLKRKQHFFMDGTFKSCSKQFYQIYTIHADLGSSENESNIHPVVFAFLPNKKKETYLRLFRIILEHVPEWNPGTVTVDFEAAVISALREVLPAVNVYGCYFHMKQCLWRKVQELGLTREYRENEEVRMQVRMCAALAFLRPEDISDGWLEIHSKSPDVTKLAEFFDYFVERWLENDEIPVSLWSCYGRRHRTTNAVEGWHSKINNMLVKRNPKVKDVIGVMRTEAESTACAIMRRELNMDGKRRKSTYRRLDERLEKTVKMYEEDGDIMACLKAISYIQKLE